jgi:hypothetical protein
MCLENHTGYQRRLAWPYRRSARGWVWGIDSVIPMREPETEGSGKDRKDCMRQFSAAWDRFSADPARLSEFLDMKRKRLP